VKELPASVATILIDTGMRPEECFRLRWENVTWLNGRNGTLLVAHGKTAAARRVIPMTQRAREVLDTEWKSSCEAQEGFVWPVKTLSGHIEPSSLWKHHTKTFKTLEEEADWPGTDSASLPYQTTVLVLLWTGAGKRTTVLSTA
jgi:integrase